jgi:hypothetical protein
LRPFESQIPGSNPGRSTLFNNNINNKNNNDKTINHKIADSLALKSNTLIKANPKDSNKILLNSVSKNQDRWTDFKAYLIAQKQSKSSIRNKVGYAQRFYYILETKDANDILKLSHGSKTHTMKALASLSKFLGKFDLWLDIIKKYQLKWAESDKSIKIFKSIFNSEGNGESIDKMIGWIKDVSKILPQECFVA